MLAPSVGCSGTRAATHATAGQAVDRSRAQKPKRGSVRTCANYQRFLEELLGGRLLPPDLLGEVLRPFEEGEIATSAGYGLGISVLELPCGVTIYGHSGGVPGYITGMFSTRDASKRLVTSFTIAFSGERSVLATMDLDLHGVLRSATGRLTVYQSLKLQNLLS
jgi:hypothetical protein